jgi:magnesium transporter
VEQAEDVQKMGAVQPIRESYFDTSFFLFLRKRGLWLLVLFIGGFGTTQAMQAYRGTLDKLTELSFYLPLLISAGGNSGAQSSTLLIRSLAVGDVKVSDWFRVFLRELLQGLTLGTLLAPFGMLRVLMMGDGLPLAMLVGLTIVTIVAMGCLIGAMTPLALHSLGLDPATSSTPLIATVVDVLGIVFYLALARLLLGGMLGLASAAQ